MPDKLLLLQRFDFENQPHLTYKIMVSIWAKTRNIRSAKCSKLNLKRLLSHIFTLFGACKNHNSLNNANQNVLEPKIVKIGSVKLEHLLSNWRDKQDFIFSDE